MSESASLAEAMLDTLCSFTNMLYILFLLQVCFLLLALFSFAFIDRGSESFVVLQVVSGFIVLSIVAILLAFRFCSRRHQDI